MPIGRMMGIRCLRSSWLSCALASRMAEARRQYWLKVHTFCALSPRLGGILGAGHWPYGRGILAVCPSLIGLGSYCEPRMPIGVAAYAHRHEGHGTYVRKARSRRQDPGPGLLNTGSCETPLSSSTSMKLAMTLKDQINPKRPGPGPADGIPPRW